MKKKAFHLTLSAICINGISHYNGMCKDAVKPPSRILKMWAIPSPFSVPYPDVLPQDGSADVSLTLFDLMALVKKKFALQGIDCQGIYGSEGSRLSYDSRRGLCAMGYLIRRHAVYLRSLWRPGSLPTH